MGGAVGRPHPRLHTIIRGTFPRSPGDNGAGVAQWACVEEPDIYRFFPAGSIEAAFIGLEIKVDPVDQCGVVQVVDCLFLFQGFGFEGTVGQMAEGTFGREVKPVVAP